MLDSNGGWRLGVIAHLIWTPIAERDRGFKAYIQSFTRELMRTQLCIYVCRYTRHCVYLRSIEILGGVLLRGPTSLLCAQYTTVTSIQTGKGQLRKMYIHYIRHHINEQHFILFMYSYTQQTRTGG